MGFNANKAYLQDEIERLNLRLQQVEEYLSSNPSVALQERLINNNIYFYIRYKENGKSISKFYSKSRDKAMDLKKELNNKNELRKKLKIEKKKLKRLISLLNSQLKIVNKALLINA